MRGIRADSRRSGTGAGAAAAATVSPVRVEELLPSGMERHVDAVPMLLTRQDGMRRHDLVVEEPFQFDELAFDEAPQRRGDVNVTAGEFETHGS